MYSNKLNKTFKNIPSFAQISAFPSLDSIKKSGAGAHTESRDAANSVPFL